MQVSYSCIGVALLGLLAIPATFQFENVSAKPVPVRASAMPAAKLTTNMAAVRQDPRIARLHSFLRSLNCPVSALSEDFIHAADDNHIDWRLLPSISVIESSGGKAFRNNNIFGWDQGEGVFPTIRSGIHEVAFKLGKSSLYRNLDTERKLHYYNPNPEYPGNVIAVMNRISPSA